MHISLSEQPKQMGVSTLRRTLSVSMTKPVSVYLYKFDKNHPTAESEPSLSIVHVYRNSDSHTSFNYTIYHGPDTNGVTSMRFIRQWSGMGVFFHRVLSNYKLIPEYTFFLISRRNWCAYVVSRNVSCAVQGGVESFEEPVAAPCPAYQQNCDQQVT